ncbi:Cysteine dioxygenase type 1 [Armadillidium vulgare]|nr:Cysteine dioxygenase type 1 [Armadillidium vulgare]
MLVCWGPSHQSTIHDHSNAHCFMKTLDGYLEEVRYAWPEDENDEMLKVTGTTTLKPNDVAYINDSLGLHRVQNPSDIDGAVSLHIYSPPFDSCQIFDERTGKKKKCHMTFWSRNVLVDRGSSLSIESVTVTQTHL